MWLLSFTAAAALSSQLLGTWGHFAQIRKNQIRGTTEGLSFFYWESRVWSKLPWFAFALSLKNVDLSLLGSMGLAIIPPFIVLLQFSSYENRLVHYYRWRTLLQAALLLGALALGLWARESISQLGFLLAVLPLLCAIVSLLGGGFAQFRLNQQRGNTDAVAGERYLLLVVSNALWLSYGLTKGFGQGWAEAWTIVACSTLGFTVYIALSAQYWALKPAKLESRSPIAPAAVLAPALQ